MASGSCNCGAVAFEVDGELDGVYVCHCSICRRATGSNGIAVVLADERKFHWIRGEDLVTHWRKPVGDWHMAFCSTCGSPLPGMNDPQRMFIPAGLISDGDDALRVAHHIWVGSKAGWDEIGDDGQQHSEAISG